MRGEEEDNEDDGYLEKTMEIRERKKKPREHWELFGEENGNRREKWNHTSKMK